MHSLLLQKRLHNKTPLFSTEHKVNCKNYYSGYPVKWQPTPVSLPGKSHGQRNLVDCSPWRCKELGTTEWLTHTHTQSSYGQSDLSWSDVYNLQNLSLEEVMCPLPLIFLLFVNRNMDKMFSILDHADAGNNPVMLGQQSKRSLEPCGATTLALDCLRRITVSARTL